MEEFKSTRYFLDLKDLFLTPIFLIIYYIIAVFLRNKFSNKVTKKYFLPALTLKFIGAIGLGLIYRYMYYGGDTANYYFHTKLITAAFYESPLAGFKLIFLEAGFDPETYKYTSLMFWYGADTEYMIARIAAIPSIFSYNTYSVIAITFAAISFSGMWAMYLTFLKIYPDLAKQFAIAVFFLPSVFFWGSGFMKDSITIGALGWTFYGFYNLLILKVKIPTSLFAFVLGAAALASIKIYILLCFLPPALFWLFNEYNSRIQNSIVRLISKPLFFAVGLSVAALGATKITEGDAKYDINNIAETTKVTSRYLSEQVTSGSQYNIGNLDGSVSSMVKATPQAIIVSLYRPFLWEARNPTMLLSAIEALYFLLFSLYCIYKAGIIKTFYIISSIPVVNFSLIFSLLFAFAVGLNSGNFGTLVRYKIPLMPFYLSALFIIQGNSNSKKQRKKNLIQLKRSF
ncbi:hypothetical protein [Rufibacter aurantiacus]|uniref:hypothetical protein n=1 Tax=Rufibacter aurantiacus TaxID=2817374 RepID=UPI001B312658|nr:hypothetical protein [Rufibacter aurantiacus]